MEDITDSKGLPLAVDESVSELANEVAWDEAWNEKAAIVLKPGVLGIERSVGLCNEAKLRGIPVVFSSCFESGVGLAHIATLAGAAGQKEIAQGLGTYTGLHRDSLPFRALVHNRDVIDLSACEGALWNFACDR